MCNLKQPLLSFEIWPCIRAAAFASGLGLELIKSTGSTSLVGARNMKTHLTEYECGPWVCRRIAVVFCGCGEKSQSQGILTTGDAGAKIPPLSSCTANLSSWVSVTMWTIPLANLLSPLLPPSPPGPWWQICAPGISWHFWILLTHVRGEGEVFCSRGRMGKQIS